MAAVMGGRPPAAAGTLEAEPPVEGEPSMWTGRYRAEDEPAAARTTEPLDARGDRHDGTGDGARLPPILPYAAMLIVGLLGGFLAGYSLGSRERAPEGRRRRVGRRPSATAPAAPQAPARQTWSEASVEGRPGETPAAATPPAVCPKPRRRCRRRRP